MARVTLTEPSPQRPPSQLEPCFEFVSARLACCGGMLLKLRRLLVFVFETRSCVAQAGPELLLFHFLDAGIITVLSVCATVPGFIQFSGLNPWLGAF